MVKNVLFSKEKTAAAANPKRWGQMWRWSNSRLPAGRTIRSLGRRSGATPRGACNPERLYIARAANHEIIARRRQGILLGCFSFCGPITRFLDPPARHSHIDDVESCNMHPDIFIRLCPCMWQLHMSTASWHLYYVVIFLCFSLFLFLYLFAYIFYFSSFA